MRPGELASLRWGDVDFENTVVHARNTEAFPTKSGRNRVVPMNPDVQQVPLSRRTGSVTPTRAAVEKRIKVSVLVVVGLLLQRSLPEVEPLHFLPRITSPVLMLNGKYDFFFLDETSQRPFFTLLGTPEADKRIIAYEGGHSVPRTALVKETLAWLDRYFGPTE